MAFGGGAFTIQNKKLPGAYINFVSLASAAAAEFSRGVAAMGLKLGWCAEGEVFTVSRAEFQKNALGIFGYPYDAPELAGVREIFIHAHTLRAYRLNSGGEHAQNSFAEAACSGVRGNAITTIISANGDKWDVETAVDGRVVDSQTVAAAAELEDNAWCRFKKEAALAENAGMPMTGGSDGRITQQSHLDFMDRVQNYSFNAIGAASDESGNDSLKVNALYADFVKRMRDEAGMKFQAVLYKHPADYEGVVNVKNCVELVYWATGLMAGMAVNASALNVVYDGELEIPANYTQQQLEAGIEAGEFMLHRVNEDKRVLADINSLTTCSDEKGEIFRQNQTVRVVDAAAMELADVFNRKYLGRISNNASGRISLWADMVKIFRDLERMGAIENFDEKSVSVEQGEENGGVVARADEINVIGAMEKLYMTIVIQ